MDSHHGFWVILKMKDTSLHAVVCGLMLVVGNVTNNNTRMNGASIRASGDWMIYRSSRNGAQYNIVSH
jgi:hypothetical protein